MIDKLLPCKVMDVRVITYTTEAYTTDANAIQRKRQIRNGMSMLRRPSYSFSDESKLAPGDDGDFVPGTNCPATNRLTTNSSSE